MGSFGPLRPDAVIWVRLPVWGLAVVLFLVLKRPRRGCSYRCLYDGLGASPAILGPHPIGATPETGRGCAPIWRTWLDLNEQCFRMRFAT